MRDLARFLIIAGAVLLVLGLILTLSGRMGLGRLPGDIVYRKGNVTFYFPLMTSIILSIALSLILWIFRR